MIAPHGGTLVERVSQNTPALHERAKSASVVSLSVVAQSDLELIATGVYSPLCGFMGRNAYLAVLNNMHLPDGLPWTLPITLPVDTDTADTLQVGQDVALADESGAIIGLLELVEKFTYDKNTEAERVYRTTDAAHPGVARLYAQGDVYLAGEIWLLRESAPEFPAIYRTPAQTRAIFAERNWRRVVAFQTRNPVHRAHEYLMKCALELTDGLMLHPLVGATKSDDIPAEVRIRCYETVLGTYFPQGRTLLTAFPAAMRYAGPREAVFHAICRKNYGCTHFIVGRDHAGVGDYYGTYDAQLIFDEFDPHAIGITPLMFEHAFYCTASRQIATAKTCSHDTTMRVHLSGTQVRERLERGEMLPEEFTRPEVSRILIEAMHQPTGSS